MERRKNGTACFGSFFQHFLSEKTSLKFSSIKHYIDALKWISEYLHEKGMLNENIYEISDINSLYSLRIFFIPRMKHLEH